MCLGSRDLFKCWGKSDNINVSVTVQDSHIVAIEDY